MYGIPYSVWTAPDPRVWAVGRALCVWTRVVCGVTVDLLLEACSELGRTMASIYTVAPVRMESVKLKSVRRS